MLNLAGPFPGKKVIINDQVEKIPRTWKQRLFTRPWKPFQKFRFEPLIPRGQVFTHEDTLYMSSATQADMLRGIEVKK